MKSKRYIHMLEIKHGEIFPCKKIDTGRQNRVDKNEFPPTSGSMKVGALVIHFVIFTVPEPSHPCKL